MKEFAKGKVEKGESLLTREEFRVYDADDSGEVEFEVRLTHVSVTSATVFHSLFGWTGVQGARAG